MGKPKLQKTQVSGNVIAFPTRHRRKVRTMPQNSDNAFAEAIQRLAPHLRDYDREDLFRVLFRLNMRDYRAKMFSLADRNGASGCDPDDFFSDINGQRRAEIEERTRAQVAALG